MKLLSLRLNGISVLVTFLLVVVSQMAFAQETFCTVTGTSPLSWVNPGPSCAQGGNAGSKTILVIPAGFLLAFGTGDTWTGTGIVVDGTLKINADVILNCSILIRDGGLLDIQAKLTLGTGPDCGYGIGVISGGEVNVGNTGSDRLNICGEPVMKGAASGSCNDCSGTNSGQCAYNGSPYCEPTGGFEGPTGYGEDGYDPGLGPILTTTLPIVLSNFTAEIVNDKVLIKWATAKEDGFDHFEVQRAGSDLEFTSIINVPGAGYNTSSREEYSAYDNNPLVGTGYYRLKAVDLDGTFEYFPMKFVNYNGGRNFYISPNPTTGSVIKYNINFDPTPYDRVVLIDAVGNELGRGLVTGVNNELIPGKTLPPGAYLLQYISGSYKGVARVFVKD